MISISTNLEKDLKKLLPHTSEVWIAVAMMSKAGWNLFKDLNKNISKHFVVGIDLPTPPKILTNLLEASSPNFSAKVYEGEYTFHPKLYIIKDVNSRYSAFVGSSNATAWGLNRNTELNVKITDQHTCKDLLKWFNSINSKATMVNAKLIEDYKVNYKSIKSKNRELTKDIESLKSSLVLNKNSFFKECHHAPFEQRYHNIQNPALKNARKQVRERLIDLHKLLIDEFPKFGLHDLHPTNRKQDRTCRYYFNAFSGNRIPSLWLHYGKSKAHLTQYSGDDRRFVNNIRIQLIIHQDSFGVWLVLGREGEGQIDRDYFRNQMNSKKFRNQFFNQLNSLGSDYWLNFKNGKQLKVIDIKSPTQMKKLTDQENIDDYFIIKADFDKRDERLYATNIAQFLLGEMQKLHPLYLLMRHI